MNTPGFQRAAFLALLIAVTAGFFVVLLPFFGAVMWAVALGMLFTPFYKWLCRRMGQRKTLAAATTLLLCLVLVILPLSMIGVALVQEISVVAAKISSGQLNFASYFEQIVQALPRWVVSSMNRFGLGNFAGWQAKIEGVATQGSQIIATHALSVGQNTFEFVVSFGVMMYLLFFMLRDGAALSKLVREALPLARPQTHYLLNKFTTVTRATIKGNVAVAVVQGGLGGLAFWVLGVQGALLWGVMMAFLSLLPAVGAAIIWLPVALYLLATGAILKGLGLIAFCALVIGLIDNMLRPILVGKETQMPDYIVLMSTIGGIGVFGINGFVIGPVIAALFMTAWSLFSDSNEPEPKVPAIDRSPFATTAPVELVLASDVPSASVVAPLVGDYLQSPRSGPQVIRNDLGH
jgi:predicted PurR-regulated permease PerM